MADFFRGVAYPFQESNAGIPALATDADLVRQSLAQILGTQKGERVMRPQFGCDLHRFVFENNDELLGQLLRTEISSAVSRWEPRVELDNVTFARSESTLTVTVTYTVLATQTQDTIQVPVPVSGP
jgi:phage baseplate assembly protein W